MPKWVIRFEVSNLAVASGASRISCAIDLKADCLIAGEVTSKIDNEIGRSKQEEIERYLPSTCLLAIGISHAGSEFVVGRDLAPFLEEQLGIPAVTIADTSWWR